jgi:hypothetical protein
VQTPIGHAVPSGAGGYEHTPLEGLQAPALWQAPGGAHATGEPPRQAPERQVSPVVQALPSSHVVPSGAAGLEHVPLAGSHTPAV